MWYNIEKYLGWMLLTVVGQAQVLVITEPSVVTFQGYQPPLAINHLPFRESVLPLSQQAIFSLNLVPGKYLITHGGQLAPNYQAPVAWEIDTNVGQFSRGLLQDYIIRPSRTVKIDTLVLHVRVPTWYRLVGSVGAISARSSQHKPTITFEIDGEILATGGGSARVVTSRLLLPGVHRFHSWINGAPDQAWCVCPSIGSGYLTTHWLGAWKHQPSQGLQVRNEAIPELAEITTGITLSENDTTALPGPDTEFTPELSLPLQVINRLLDILL